MNIRDIMNESMIEVGAEFDTKDEALDRLIELQKKSGSIQNALTLKREIKERERLGTSAVSMRVAIPGVRHSGAEKTVISAITVKDGIEYDAPDKRKVKLIFMIAGRDGSDEYIEAKSRLMHLLMDSEFTAGLCAADSAEEFMTLLTDKERSRYSPNKPDIRYDCSKYIKHDQKPTKKLRRKLFGR